MLRAVFLKFMYRFSKNITHLNTNYVPDMFIYLVVLNFYALSSLPCPVRHAET